MDITRLALGKRTKRRKTQGPAAGPAPIALASLPRRASLGGLESNPGAHYLTNWVVVSYERQGLMLDAPGRSFDKNPSATVAFVRPLTESSEMPAPAVRILNFL